MAIDHSNLLNQQPEVVQIADRLQAIAAQLAGVKPILDNTLEDVPAEAGNTLALVAGLVDYTQKDLSSLAELLQASAG